MALPAERTNGQIRIDPVDRAGIQRAVGFGHDAAERDGLGGEWLLDPASFRFCTLACGVRLGMQLGAHLACQAGDRTQAEDVRRIALIGASNPFAVASHERVLRLRAGAVGAALRVTAEAAERVGTSGSSEVDATQSGRV